MTLNPAGPFHRRSVMPPELINLRQMYDAKELRSIFKVMTRRLVFKTAHGIERNSQILMFQKDYIETFNSIQVE